MPSENAEWVVVGECGATESRRLGDGPIRLDRETLERVEIERRISTTPFAASS